MILQREDAVCIEEFVNALLKMLDNATRNQNGIAYGYSKGWLMEQDKNSCLPLTKKQCARIVHEFLRIEQAEPDEIDSGPAGKLQDLFDCRVCAGHVMQGYTKGIMEGYRDACDRFIFGMEDVVTKSVAEIVIQRIFYKKKRVPVAAAEAMVAKELKFCEADVLLEQKKCLLVDVRTEADYREKHLPSAIHYPMMEILKNPYGVCERRDMCILLYCEKGYMSETAAQSLARAGYENVSYFAWDCVG